MGRRRSSLEKSVQRDIELALGCEPDLLLLRNSVGTARFTKEDGSEYFVPYGLGDGSPDLVGLLRVRTNDISRCVAIWFCLEVKPPEVKGPEPHQEKCHETWRRFGAVIETVHSVEEARAALERARRIAC